MKKRTLLILYATLIILVVSFVIIEVNNISVNQALSLEELKSLPYLTYTKEKVNESLVGVVNYNPELAFDGYNLYENKLMDMKGNIVHSWLQDTYFMIILNNGETIMLLGDDNKIGKYSWDSRVIWEKKLISHHDITLTSNNTILIPSREMHEYNGRKVEFDLIIELSQDGEELSRWSTYENFDYIKKFHGPSELDQPINIYNESKEEVYDYYHLNSIQVLPETNIGKKDNRFQAGNWLLSFCYVNLILILDRKTKEIVWSWGPGELDGQHSPKMLDNGNILIYDNGLKRRYTKHPYTRIIELDPIKKKVVWEYRADPPESFFSNNLGYSQRLPNENTLITDSNNGRVFEITKEGEIVWKWFNPEINKEGKRETIYRMVRYPKDKIDKLLELNKK